MWTRFSKRLLSPEFARAHLPLTFALQETRSWDVQNLSLLGFVFMSVILGSLHSLCQTFFLQNTEIMDI